MSLQAINSKFRDGEEYFTFDDVLIVPNVNTSVEHRSDVCLSTRFSRNVEIKVPLVSSPMDSVTDANMCIAMHRAGGIGVLHRFFDKDDWKKQINILTNYKEAPVQYAIAVGLYDYQEKLDFFCDNLHFLCPVAVVMDVAHGGMDKVLTALTKMLLYSDIYGKWVFDIIAGNVASAEAAKEVAKLRVDGIRCGVGCGSICTTRLNTGVGVPLLSSILECRTAIDEIDENITLIADGGVQHIGDCTKALAAGADCIMSGRIFADTQESPGWEYDPDKRAYVKPYMGMARFGERLPEGVIYEIVRTIGNEITVRERIQQYVDGIQSGCSYCGASNIQELRKKAKFIRVTTNTLTENKTRKM